MPTRISAVYTWSPLFPCFWLIWSLSIVKLLIFPYTCLFTFFERSPQLFLGTRPITYSGKSAVSQYASYSLIFSPLRSVINRGQHEKHLYNQSSHYWKYGMDNHQSACPSYWYKSGCVALTGCIITLCFASSSSNVWLTFQAKNNIALLLTLHSPKSCTEAIMHAPQIVTYMRQGRKEWSTKENKGELW